MWRANHLAGTCGCVRSQVKQVRTADAYETMVLTVNEWILEQGFEAFCHVVEVAEKRYCTALSSWWMRTAIMRL